MSHSNRTLILRGICLAFAGGLVLSQGAFAHDDKPDHDMMEKMDANHDRMISATEHSDFAATMFARLDANHDGMLSKAEPVLVARRAASLKRSIC